MFNVFFSELFEEYLFVFVCLVRVVCCFFVVYFCCSCLFEMGKCLGGWCFISYGEFDDVFFLG